MLTTSVPVSALACAYVCVPRLPGSLELATYACNAHKTQGCVTECVMCPGITLNVWEPVAVGGKKRKEKTTPFGVNLMRSPVLYRAAQDCWW